MNKDLFSKYKDKSKKLIPLNKALIDSTTIRIKMSDCVILDEKFTSLTSTYIQATGEIVNEDSPPIPFKIVRDGVTFRIKITQIPIWDEKKQERVPTRFIEIVLTCKLLRERYFEGINKNNLRHFYDCFMSYNVFKCSFESFCNSQTSDTDICINRHASSKQVFLGILNELFIMSGTSQKYIQKKEDANHIAMYFNNRDNAKPSIPFVKLYHKELELFSKSVDFYQDYLFPKYTRETMNLTRIEATIKNAKHKTRLYKYKILPQYKTLKELTELKEIDLRRFVIFSLSAYIKQQIRKKAPNLSPTDHIIFELIQNCILHGDSKDQILNIKNTFKGNSDQTTINGKNRIKNRIEYLYDLLVMKDVKIQSKVMYNNHIYDYLNFLGLK